MPANVIGAASEPKSGDPKHNGGKAYNSTIELVDPADTGYNNSK